MNLQKEHIKSIIIVVLSIITIVLAYRSFFPKPHPLPAKSFEDLPLPPDDSPSESVRKMQVIVLQYGSNPRGDIDKILVDINGDSTWLHFPPHTAKQVVSIAKLQATVIVEYAEREDKKGKVNREEIKTISNNKNETVDIRNILPPPPSRGNEVTIAGYNVEIKKDETGRVIAFTLSNKLIVLPPQTAENLLPLITSAKTIEVMGTERGDRDGFVNINGLGLVQPDEITIDNVKYLMR